MAFTSERLLERLETLPAVKRYLIAFSGGLDSTVLLHALARHDDRTPRPLTAVHVHHGLQPQADGWADHCRRACGQLGVPFSLIRVDALADQGESPEAAAREARYRVLKGLVESGVCLLTAHQQDDQAETLLLQLLRGSGPAGLAAMPEVAPFGDGWHARPLLSFTRAELAAYAALHQLRFVDDPSNHDTTHDRNFIRHEVLPKMSARWPSAAHTLSRAASLQAQSAELLAELAQRDLRSVAGSRPQTLSVKGLRQLSPARQRNVLRHWLMSRELAVPTQRQLERILIDAIGARVDSTPVVTWGSGEVRRYRNDLYAMAPLPEHDPAMVLYWDPRRPLSISHLGITLEPSLLDGLAIAPGADPTAITVRFRRGGERCRPRGQRHHRDLKKLFQETGVPPWERDRIPLIYQGHRLLAVVGHWTCDAS